jgi:hypothetical protein
LEKEEPQKRGEEAEAQRERWVGRRSGEGEREGKRKDTRKKTTERNLLLSTPNNPHLILLLRMTHLSSLLSRSVCESVRMTGERWGELVRLEGRRGEKTGGKGREERRREGRRGRGDKVSEGKHRSEVRKGVGKGERRRRTEGGRWETRMEEPVSWGVPLERFFLKLGSLFLFLFLSDFMDGASSYGWYSG